MRHHPIAKILFVSFALAAASTAPAQAFENEITPYLGYRTGGSFDASNIPGRYNISDAESYGLIVGFTTPNQAQLEVHYAKQETDARFDRVTPNDRDVDLDLETLEVGGIYEFNGRLMRPYVSGTVGATRVGVRSTESRSDTFLSGSFGLGLKYRPDDRVGARLEVRLRGIVVSSSTGLFCSTGTGGSGCSVAIGGNVVGQVETFAGLVFRF